MKAKRLIVVLLIVCFSMSATQPMFVLGVNTSQSIYCVDCGEMHNTDFDCGQEYIHTLDECSVIVRGTYDRAILIDYLNNRINSSWPNGYCLAFVATAFNDCYGYSSSSCCAYQYGNSYIDSNSQNNIPIGADVFFGGSNVICSCGNRAGHIAIYVGDGNVVHAWDGKIVKTTIQYVINCGYPYRRWGWHANNELSDISDKPDDYTVPTRDLFYTTPSMTGSDVGWVQAVLKRFGYAITIDCSFGPATEATVKQFQRDNELYPDGVVGLNTRTRLLEKWRSEDLDEYIYPTRELYNTTPHMMGLDVGWVQCILRKAGYPISVDCSFGIETERFVKAFQQDNGLSIDGVVGPTTRGALQTKWDELNIHIVKFKDGLTGSIISTVYVHHGESVSLPAPPVHNGYIFKGWDKDGKNIIEDTTITAIYEKTVDPTPTPTQDPTPTPTQEPTPTPTTTPTATPTQQPTPTPTQEPTPTATPTPTTQPTIEPTQQPGVKLGDLNSDGKVNTSDAVLVLKEAAGIINLTTEQLTAGDTNHDGKVNTADAVLILKYAAGMITHL